MSLCPQQPIPSVPADTAHAAFRRGNPYLTLRDELGAVFGDADFADLYPRRGQPAYAPWRLALVTVMQFREGFSDRQAADAVRARIDWKYLLGLELADPGFDHSILCEFRGRLLTSHAEERLLARVLDGARDRGLLRARGRQRTGSTHVLAAVRDLNRVELLAESLRAALNAIAAVAPDWLRVFAPPEWHKRYDRRIETARLPEAGPKRDACAVQVGEDGYRLLDALDRSGTPRHVAALPAAAALRRVWARHFEPGGAGRDGDGGGDVRLRPTQGRGSGDRIEPPCDTDARYRAKGGVDWTGYMAHLTGSCDSGMPRLVLHADTTPANMHEAMRTEAIHEALAAKDLAPAEHLVDSADVSADHLITARTRHGVGLVGPSRRNMSWQGRTEDAFDAADFAVDWERRVARCSEGKESARWNVYKPDSGEGPLLKAVFRSADCRPCPSRPRCTRSAAQPRHVLLRSRAGHEALAAARSRERDREYRKLYAQRRSVEGTLSQAVRTFGLRRARHRGLAKAGLQNVATAASLNLDRIAPWLAKRPLAPTRTSRFAALAALAALAA